MNRCVLPFSELRLVYDRRLTRVIVACSDRDIRDMHTLYSRLFHLFTLANADEKHGGAKQNIRAFMKAGSLTLFISYQTMY